MGKGREQMAPTARAMQDDILIWRREPEADTRKLAKIQIKLDIWLKHDANVHFLA